MDFGEVLLEVGDSGKYQKKLIVFLLLPIAIIVPWTKNFYYILDVPDHWCSVPEVVSSNLTLEQQRTLISPPYSNCYMYDINYTHYLSTDDFYEKIYTSNTMPCNKGWEYDKANFGETPATRWSMFCEDEHYIRLVLTLYDVGSIIGTPIYGALSDRIGRRITFFILLAVTAISALASVLTPDFTTFLIIKTVNGSIMPCVWILPFIIILELVAPEKRTHVNGLLNCAWAIGQCILPFISELAGNWITLTFVTSSLTLSLFAYSNYLPESPGWLLTQERYDDALVILRKVADQNGKSIDNETLLSKLKLCGEKRKKEKTVYNILNSSMDLLRYPQMRKIFIILSFCWTANTMIYYYALLLKNYTGNEYISYYILPAIAKISGYVTSWILMDKFGRRWFTAASFVLAGFACIIPVFELRLRYADITCFMLGQYFAAATMMAVYQMGSELYPTVTRSLGLGMNTGVSVLLIIIMDYSTNMEKHGEAMPFVICGITSVLAGILASFLPETLNENLPQTVSDVEEFGKRQRYFSLHRRIRSVCRERRASQKIVSEEEENEHSV